MEDVQWYEKDELIAAVRIYDADEHADQPASVAELQASPRARAVSVAKHCGCPQARPACCQGVVVTCLSLSSPSTATHG